MTRALSSTQSWVTRSSRSGDAHRWAHSRAQATILIHELGHLMNGIAAPKPVRFCPAIARWIRLNSRSWRSADECSIIGRVTESWQQGSTRAARQPSIRACASWSRTEGDRKHNHLDPPQPNRTGRVLSLPGDSGARRTGFRGEREHDSGVRRTGFQAEGEP